MILDTQSIKNAATGRTVGFDAGKLVKGCKRLGLIDTLGNVLASWVVAASESDAATAIAFWDTVAAHLPLLGQVQVVLGSSSFAGLFADHLCQQYGLRFEKPMHIVYGLALGVAGLITSEFLSVSLLTPMARDLRVTEGIAGQAISITAIVAMVASLLISVVTQRLDRRWVLLSFSLLQILSNVLVAVAPSFLVLTIGRVLLGLAIGGFWAMSAAIAMRLVPEKVVPKALSIVFGAVSVATVVAAPLGSYFGGLLGWRTMFLLAGGLGALSLVWQAVTLPALPPEKPVGVGTMLHLLKRPRVGIGMVATMFIFMGYASFFTYLRPFLETVTGVSVNTLSTILLGFGLANLAGTVLARYPLERNLKLTLTLLPLAMGLLVGALVVFGRLPVVASVLVALWGLLFGGIQVGWPTWLTRTLPDEAEVAGGLQIAAIQLANTTGAAVGGLFFDLTGALGVFSSSSAITLLAALMALLAFRKSASQPPQTTQPKKNELVAH